MDSTPKRASGLRPVSEIERDLSEHLIRGALPSAGELIEQLRDAQVRGEPPFVEFEVTPAAPRASGVSKGLIEGRNTDPDSMVWTHILLWIEDGCISALELSWVSDEAPGEFPNPDQVEVEPPSRADPRGAAADARKRRLLTWPMLIVGAIGVLAGLVAGITFVGWIPALEGMNESSRSRLAGGLGFLGALMGALGARRLVLLFRR